MAEGQRTIAVTAAPRRPAPPPPPAASAAEPLDPTLGNAPPRSGLSVGLDGGRGPVAAPAGAPAGAPAAAPAAPAPAAPPAAAQLPPPAAAPEEPSEIERRREQGARAFDAALGTLARRAVDWRQLVGRCYGPGGLRAESPEVTLPSQGLGVGGCRLTREDAARLGREIVADLERAEDEARRSWVPPGTQRELREKHGLDSAAVARLEGEIRAVER